MKYFRTPVLKSSFKGVDKKRRILKGAAVITRGEAKGHGIFIDRSMLEQVVEVGNEAPRGVKSRFTHPGLCADGLGNFLGRFKNFRLADDEDIVRADLQISEAAEEEKVSHILKLAAADPEAFGNSIVFDRDLADEDKFIAEHTEENEDGDAFEFQSPDEKNENNFRHARVGELRAVDLVDDPAANDGGFFSDGEEAAARAERVLSYVLGVSSEEPTPIELGHQEPERVKAFVENFLERHGLAILQEKASHWTKEQIARYLAEAMSDEERQKMSKVKTKSAKASAKIDDDVLFGKCKECGSDLQDDDDDEKDEDDDEEKEKEEKAQDHPDDDDEEKEKKTKKASVADLKSAFSDRPEFVLECLEAGLTMGQAKSKFKDVEIAELKAKLEKKQKSEGEGADAVGFTRTGNTGQGSFIELAKAYQEENGGTIGEAMKRVCSANPKSFAKMDPDLDAKHHQMKTAGIKRR